MIAYNHMNGGVISMSIIILNQYFEDKISGLLCIIIIFP